MSNVSPKLLSEERKALERLVYRALVSIVVIAAVCVLVPIAWDKLSPFIVCLPVAAMLQPAVRFLESKCKFKHSPAVLVPVLLVMAIVCAIIIWFASFGIRQVSNLIANAPALIPEIISLISRAFETVLSRLSDVLPQETIDLLRSSLNDATKWLTSNGMDLAGQLAGFAGKIAAGLPYAFVYLNFLLIGLYFVTKEYDNLRSKLPGGRAYDPNTNASRLTNTAVGGTLGYLRIQGIYGGISLIVGWIYLQAFGYRYAWLIACVAGFLEFLPLFGNGTLYIPWALIAYVLGMNEVGTQILVLYLLLITFRRITEPKIMSANMGVPPLLSIVGMFVGMRFGGLLGLIGGPVVMTVLVAVVQGHYLDGINRDINTIWRYLYSRWDYHTDKPPMPEPKEPAEPEKPAKPESKKPAAKVACGKKN